MGVKIDLDTIEMMEERPLLSGNNLVGHLRSAVYSPLSDCGNWNNITYSEYLCFKPKKACPKRQARGKD